MLFSLGAVPVVLLVLGFSLEFLSGPNALGGLAPWFAVLGILGSGGFLGLVLGSCTAKG